MKKSLLVLLLLFPLLAFSQRDLKLVDQSQSQRPSWLTSGNNRDAFMVQVNRMASLQDAQDAVMASLLENIASSARVHSVPEVDVTMMETKSHFNSKSNKIFVIAFINKTEAHRFYKRQADVIFNNVEKHITITETYVETGFMSKAKEEIKKAEAEFKKLEQPIFFLTVFDCPDYELHELLQRYSGLEQTVKRKISEMEYGTSIYVECVADMFGQSYFNLQKELKAKLSENGCNFVDDKAWRIGL